MKKIVFLIATALIFCSFTSDKKVVVPSGEKLVYAGSYNMSGLMTHLAQVTMSTETITTAKNSYLHLNCELATFSKWDKFFKIRDIYESYVDPITLKPSLYKRSIDEGGYTKNEEGFFNQDENKVLVKDYKNKNEKTVSVTENVQDAVSAFYYLRN